MGPIVSKSLALFLIFNILSFTACISSHQVPCSPPKSSTTPTLPSPPTVPKKESNCPIDTLKFGVCGSWFGLINEQIGTKPSKECCALLTGLADLEAALCLCTALKANVLGVLKLKVPVALSLLVNSCGKKVPQGFVCA